MWAMRLALCLQIGLLFAQVAEAQSTQPDRPYRGLFGQRTRDPKGREQLVDFTMTLSDAYDDNRINDAEASASNLPLTPSGMHSNVDAAVRYTRGRREERRLSLTGGSALRYEPQLDHLLTANYQGTVAFTSPLWHGSRLDVSQGAAYTPYYQLQLFPTISVEAADAPPRPSTDYAIWQQPAYTFNSAIVFSQTFSVRTGLQLAYDRRNVMFTGQAQDLLTDGASVKFTHRFTRSLGIHLGLGTRTALYGGVASPNVVRVQDIDIGIDSGRSISLSRRTTLSFSTGSSLIPQGDKYYYRVTGDASLRREIGRTWTANLQYSRGLRFIEAVPYPFLSDSVSAGVRGNLNRRWDLGASGGYSNGQVGVIATNGTYGAYTGSAQLGVSITRHYALYSEYVFYHYLFTQESVAGAFPARLDRNTARIGLKLWFPLLD
jgi:hypothetical protein